MQIENHIRAIQADLSAAAALGGEDVAEAGRRLGEAVTASLGMRLLDVLTEAALTLSEALPDGRVEVRLSGREPDLVYVREDAGPEPGVQPGDDTSARITLRLPEALKGQVEEAAAREGVSANAWIVRALARALEPRGPSAPPVPGSRPGRPGTRLQGFARS